MIISFIDDPSLFIQLGRIDHILPECALGYKKIDNGMVTFPMILDDFWTRKKVSPKYSPTSFQNIAIFQIYRCKIEMNLKIGQLRNDFSAF